MVYTDINMSQLGICEGIVNINDPTYIDFSQCGNVYSVSIINTTYFNQPAIRMDFMENSVESGLYLIFNTQYQLLLNSDESIMTFITATGGALLVYFNDGGKHTYAGNIIVYSIAYDYTNEKITGGGIYSGIALGGSAMPPDFVQDINNLPNVSINVKSTSDGKEVSDITIKIIDNYQYKLCGECLYWKYNDTAIETSIVTYHPDFASVVKGCGCTLAEKLANYLGGTLTDPDTIEQSKLIVNYATLVYAFSLLIYDNLDVNYLRQSFFCKFIQDLQSSKFNFFAQLFIDPKYGLVGLQEVFIY